MKVIFWDFDGTLTIAPHLWARSVYTALVETDPDTHVTYEMLDPHLHHDFPWHDPNKDFTPYVGERWWEYMYGLFYDAYTLCGVDDKTARTAAVLARDVIKRVDNYSLYPDVHATLQACKEKGYINVMLSNNYPDLWEVVEDLKIDHYFDGLVVSGQEGYDKPRAELYQIAKERFPAEEYYMVGDNPYADVMGGKAAGLKTVFVHRGFYKEADYCFDDLYSICNIL